MYIYIRLGCGRTKPLATLPHCQITTLPPPPPSQPPPPSSAAPIEKVSVPSIPACSHANINRKISKVIILNLKGLIQTQAGQEHSAERKASCGTWLFICWIKASKKRFSWPNM